MTLPRDLRAALVIGFGWLAWLGTAGAPAEPPSARVARLWIEPPAVRLDHGADRERFAVFVEDEGGVMRDVTEEAELELADPRVAAVAGGGLLAPRAEGRTWLGARHGGAEARVPVEVVEAGAAPPASFHRDVVPVLTRAGCNAGGCHGSAAGKNGFALSLFGYDPPKDHERLTRELRGRRVDPSDPPASLLLAKPTAAVAHEGGVRLDKDGPFYDALRRWIAEGAALDDPDRPRLSGIDVRPPTLVLDAGGAPARVIVRARYDDGSDRDVTELAILSSTNPGVAAVDLAGRVTPAGPGEAFVMARFGTFAEVAQVICIDAAKPFAWTPPEGLGPIDRLAAEKLRRLRVEPAPRADDGTFIRRATLDVLNVLPSAEEVRAFLDDPAPDKRERLLDRLLARPELSDLWAMQWAEVLRIDDERLRRKGMNAYTRFLREAFAEGVPFDEIVRRILTASGGHFESPAAGFYVIETDPKAVAEQVAQVFLGIRIQCAQCHNHPFERWTMDDYYGFAAFFAQVGIKRGDDPRERIVHHRGSGSVRNPRDGKVAALRFLGGEAPVIPPGADPRAALATWLTADDNPWFAANVANRIAARFFGRGLVEPPDDVRVSNPPSHPELHAWLGRRLVELRYDLRRFIRELCLSETYQRAIAPPGAPASALAGAAVRRLSAEQLLDGIAETTGVPTKLAGLPLGARATRLEGGNPLSYFLDAFGRPRRTSACTCERRGEPTLGQALHLINGDTVAAKIADPQGRLHRRLREGWSDRAILEELYLAAYARRPTEAEIAKLLAEIAAAPERAPVLEDIAWAVLNSDEFLFQH